VKKNTIQFFATAYLSTCIFSSAKADTGKIIPNEFLWLLVVGFFSLLIFLVLFLSNIIKLLYIQKNKEKPNMLILIILLSILLPIIWLFLEANFHILFSIETKTNYRIKEFFNYGITFLSAILGIGLGYIIKKVLK
jgi:hypothetical protein